MSARDVIANALCAVWSVADAERDADGILAALHAMPAADRIALARALVPDGWVVAKVPEGWVEMCGMSEYGIGEVHGHNDCRAQIIASSEETP